MGGGFGSASGHVTREVVRGGRASSGRTESGKVVGYYVALAVALVLV